MIVGSYGDAFDRYAINAFEAHALDYLLKPFNNARFARAFDRARERIDGRLHRTPMLSSATLSAQVGARDHHRACGGNAGVGR